MWDSEPFPLPSFCPPSLSDGFSQNPQASTRKCGSHFGKWWHESPTSPPAHGINSLPVWVPWDRNSPDSTGCSVWCKSLPLYEWLQKSRTLADYSKNVKAGWQPDSTQSWPLVWPFFFLIGLWEQEILFGKCCKLIILSPISWESYDLQHLLHPKYSLALEFYATLTKKLLPEAGKWLMQHLPWQVPEPEFSPQNAHLQSWAWCSMFVI